MLFKQVPFVIDGTFSLEKMGDDGHYDAADDGAKTATADTLHLDGLGEGGEGMDGDGCYEVVMKGAGVKVKERK